MSASKLILASLLAFSFSFLAKSSLATSTIKLTVTSNSTINSNLSILSRSCQSTDQLSFKITGTNTDGNYLYFFLVNVSATGLNSNKSNNQFYRFSRNIDWGVYSYPTSQTIILRGLPIMGTASSVYYKIPSAYIFTDAQGNQTQYNTGVEDITAHAYMSPSDFSGSGQFDEFIYKNPITLRNAGLPKGLWMAVALLAKVGFNIDDPNTWTSWDAVPIIFGVPWRTANNDICG